MTANTGLAPGNFARSWASNRALITIMMVNFVSLAGFGLMFPVFAVHGRQIGADGWTITGSVAAFSFGQFLSSPFWGRFSDTYGRRPVLTFSLVAGAFFYLLHIVALTPLTLILARFASGLAGGSFSVAFAVAADISTRETRTKIMGFVGSGFSLGFIFGPAIGGLTASLTSEADAFTLVCAVGAGLGIAAAVMTWFLLPETRVPREHVAGPPMSLAAMLATPGLATLAVVALFSALAFAKMESVLALFAGDVLKLHPFGIGLLFAGMGITTTVTQFTSTDRMARWLGERKLLLASLGVVAIGMLFLGLATALPLAALGLLFTSIGFALMNPALSALTSLAAPEDAQGTAMGLIQSASSLGRVVGPVMAGGLYEWLGPTAPFSWASGLLVAVLAFAMFMRVGADSAG
jgi:DHA1 family tetracycline resistance protein-like MFS transporter